MVSTGRQTVLTDRRRLKRKLKKKKKKKKKDKILVIDRVLNKAKSKERSTKKKKRRRTQIIRPVQTVSYRVKLLNKCFLPPGILTFSVSRTTHVKTLQPQLVKMTI